MGFFGKKFDDRELGDMSFFFVLLQGEWWFVFSSRIEIKGTFKRLPACPVCPHRRDTGGRFKSRCGSGVRAYVRTVLYVYV